MTADAGTIARARSERSTAPTVQQIFLCFFRLGLTAFGGPAMVAYIGELAVIRKKWLDHATFKDGVALAQSIPGATAMQTAAYVGFQARGLSGALAAYVGFGLPAFLLMVLLSFLYASYRNLSWVTTLFHGLQVIVVAIVANAVLTFGRSSLKRYTDVLLAAASASALLLGVSPFFVILGSALIGAILFKTEAAQSAPPSRPPSAVRSTGILIVLILVAICLLCLFLTSFKLLTLALLMMKIDLFAFGGGFASLPLMLHQIVDVHGWMDAQTFMDGVALGQITPGPIVITATFIGYLLYALPGAIVATLAIFAPSFVLIVMTAPFFHRMKQSALFVRATKGILVSFVGLLLFVVLKFAVAAPWDAPRIAIAAATFLALIKKVDTLYIVPLGAVLSAILLK